MEGIFESEGRLSVVVARGWISAREASDLAMGSAVRGSTLAGEGAEILFNGRFMARGEIVILGAPDTTQVSEVRITGFDRPPREEAEPERGDDLVEILPFEVVFGEAPYSLAELAGAGPESILSLDCRYEEEPRCELRIAGILAGKGRSIVVGERMGILLDDVAPARAARSAAGAPRRTDSVLDPGGRGGERIKIYDWRKPDRFTKASILGLMVIHESALDALRERFPVLASASVELVDQLTWREWLEGGASKGTRLIRSQMERPTRSYEREKPRAAPIRPLIQPGRPKIPLGPEMAERTAAWIREEGERMERKPLFIFAALSASSLLDEGGALLSCLRSGWRLLSDCVFSETEELSSPPLLSFGDDLKVTGDERGLLGDEMIALVSIKVEGGSLHLVYAARAVYPFCGALDRYGRLKLPL
ncbi:MAG: hypothetical protein Q8M76_06555 [Spirochaetaceae bacterium]|nr:hypothetical protein [Spirochaetaceae bacterium]